MASPSKLRSPLYPSKQTLPAENWIGPRKRTFNVRLTPRSGRSHDLRWTSAYDPGCVKTIFWRPRRNIKSRSRPSPQQSYVHVTLRIQSLRNRSRCPRFYTAWTPSRSPALPSAIPARSPSVGYRASSSKLFQALQCGFVHADETAADEADRKRRLALHGFFDLDAGFTLAAPPPAGPRRDVRRPPGPGRSASACIDRQ